VRTGPAELKAERHPQPRGALMVAMARATRANPASAPSAERMPAWIEPQLAALVKAAPDGDAWLHEIKLDGYRMHARLENGAVRLLTRRGNDWTDKYPAIAAAVASLPARAAYLDGELCGMRPDGRTAFNLIQNAGSGGAGVLPVRPAVSRW
jgi:ATP-dependent DNA ligase